VSVKLVPFESFGAVSYSLSIVIVAVSVAVCEIFSVKEWHDLENHLESYRLRDIATYWYKIAKFLYPTCIYRPPPAGGDPVGIS